MTPKSIAHSGLTFRRDYFDDLKAWQALVDLLKVTFDIDISPLQHWADPTRAACHGLVRR